MWMGMITMLVVVVMFVRMVAMGMVGVVMKVLFFLVLFLVLFLAMVVMFMSMIVVRMVFNVDRIFFVMGMGMSVSACGPKHDCANEIDEHTRARDRDERNRAVELLWLEKTRDGFQDDVKAQRKQRATIHERSYDLSSLPSE